MAQSRKDSRGRVLRKGENQRTVDGRYSYTYTDPLGRRKWIYASDLVELREKEQKLVKDQLDGLDLYVSGKATVNDTFDRYISTKYDLRDSTKSNYTYMYDKFVRNTFGMKKLTDVKYSDVLAFYYYLINEMGLALNTIDTVHSVLHPTFELAVRDDIIRKNPTDGVKRELSKKAGKNKGVRHALLVEEQSAFMDYIANNPIYCKWWPLFAVLLGTGCRIGECLGLRWEDLDYDNRVISINHSLVYYPNSESRTSELKISLPKTAAGIRSIPMLDTVKEAFEMEYEEQKEIGFNEQVVDGMSGFIFQNRFGQVLTPSSVNRTIKRIINSHNSEEMIAAKRERREALMLPNFSCHHLRHTFATRLCEIETNLKVIQDIMGHRNIQTTMDIYAEATERKKQESFETLATKLSGVF